MIEDDENGNVKYVIFPLRTCQLPMHIASIKQSHANNIYRRGENERFYLFDGVVCVCAENACVAQYTSTFHRLSNQIE